MYAGYTETKEQVKARWKLMQRRAAKRAKKSGGRKPSPSR